MTANGKKGKYVRVRPEDIVGSVEAAEILGVERTRVARYRKTGVLPTPWRELRATPVWLRKDIERIRDAREAEREPTESTGTR